MGKLRFLIHDDIGNVEKNDHHPAFPAGLCPVFDLVRDAIA
jgi:hypothetical protein